MVKRTGNGWKHGKENTDELLLRLPVAVRANWLMSYIAESIDRLPNQATIVALTWGHYDLVKFASLNNGF